MTIFAGALSGRDHDAGYDLDGSGDIASKMLPRKSTAVEAESNCSQPTTTTPDPAPQRKRLKDWKGKKEDHAY